MLALLLPLAILQVVVQKRRCIEGEDALNWDSQFSSEQPVASWKLRRQAVRCPGLQRSTMKCPRDFPVALTLSLYSS